MFSRIDPKELDQNVFSMIGEQWMLVTAGTAERCNTMTASWGGLGVLWGKPVATVYIRPQRYTLEFVEREDCFTPVSYTHLESRGVTTGDRGCLERVPLGSSQL